MFSYLWGGETCNCPAGVKLIAEWFPAEERPLASGIFNSGAAIGTILALPLLAWIAPRAGVQNGISDCGFGWLCVVRGVAVALSEAGDGR